MDYSKWGTKSQRLARAKRAWHLFCVCYFFMILHKVVQAYTSVCMLTLKGIVKTKAKDRFIRKKLIPYEAFS